MAKLLAAALMFGISASDAGKSKIVFIGDSYAAGVRASELQLLPSPSFVSYKIPCVKTRRYTAGIIIVLTRVLMMIPAAIRPLYADMHISN